MSFSIRYAGRDYPLSEGRSIIGRSEDCQLCLDDPVASRHHAALTVRDGTVSLEDLNSRNGVYLNEQRVTRLVPLNHGDKIRIGSQDLLLVLRSEKGRADTLIQRETTASGISNAFGVLGGLAEKAIGMGRGDEAERIIGRQLEAIVYKLEEGHVIGAEVFDSATLYSLRLAELTKKSRWVNCLFHLHTARAQLLDAETVNVLYSLGPKLDASSRPALRDYISALLPLVETFAPGDRFIMKRLEGLEQVLR